VPKDSKVAINMEIFGPVVPIIGFDTDKEIPFTLTAKNSLDKSGALEFEIDGKLLEAQEEAKDPKNLIPYREVKKHWANV
jgi:hypothetical protein